MRNLILGATGQIGSLVYDACESRGEPTLGTRYRSFDSRMEPFDLLSPDSLTDLIARSECDTVYLTAGMSQIDFAEVHPEECHATNVVGVDRVAQICHENQVKLVFVSTDHVFGECKTAKNEDSEPAPINSYGRSYAEAEACIRDRLPDRHLIVRTSFVYGPQSRNRNPLLATLRKLANRQAHGVAVDRQCQPTYGPDLADTLVSLNQRGATGTYHAVGPDRMTEHAFATTIAFLFGYDSDLVEPARTQSLGEDAPRPMSRWLNRMKLRSELGAKVLRAPSEALRQYREVAIRQRTNVA